jgi:hypothetical protein
MSWLVLGAILLSTATTFVPVDSRFFPPLHPSSAFTQSCPDCSDWLFKDTASASHELGLQCERQNKQVIMRVQASTLLHQLRARNGHCRPTREPVFSPARLFFPRKLSPPSAADEPFLS